MTLQVHAIKGSDDFKEDNFSLPAKIDSLRHALMDI